MLNTILSVLQVFLSVGVIFLVLLHSGKDAGMSGAFGVGVAGGSSGGSLMEKQPGSLDDPVRRAVRGEHDRDPQDLGDPCERNFARCFGRLKKIASRIFLA